MDKDFLKIKEKNLRLVEESWSKGVLKNFGLPTRMTLNTNHTCNLKCIMCQFHRDPAITKRLYTERKELPADLFEKFADETFPTTYEIETTTVGEPILSSYFDLINEKAREYQVKLYVTSNGTLLTRNWLENIFPNMSTLVLSIDAVDPEIYSSIRVGADIRSVEKTISIFNDLKKNHNDKSPELTLQMTLMKRNIEELPKMIAYAKEVGANNVKAYHAYIYDSNFLSESLFYNQKKTNEILLHSEQLAKKLDINIFIPKPFNLNTQKNTQDRKIKYTKPPCLFLWKEAFLEPNGDISSCFFPYRMKMGSIKESSFTEIWNNKLYQSMRKLISKPKPGNICETCELRNTYIENYNGSGINIDQFDLTKNDQLDYFRP